MYKTHLNTGCVLAYDKRLDRSVYWLVVNFTVSPSLIAI